jgi:hydroxyethylthiazole kinase-like uncharacterized protein yjeF
MIELLTPAQMAEADRLTIAAGTPGIALMERAGRAVADAAMNMTKPGARIVVACGPGNNGGDGFVAARLLAERGYQVRVLLLGSRVALADNAAEAAKAWPGEVEPVGAAAIADADLVIDALFGAGLARDLAAAARRAVEVVAAAAAPVLAVDLPSGIDGATGQVRGAAVRASETVTFCRRKPGHLLMPGRLHCGKVIVADIGISDATVAAVKPRTFANEPALWRDLLPVPRADGHKYDRGHAVVVSGPMHATGAARLAARATLRVGAGLVTVAAPRVALPVLAASLTAVMVREANGAKGLAKLLADPRLNVVLLGPGQGVGKGTRDAAAAAAKAKRALVLDADALTSFAGRAAELARLLRSASAAVVTPHEGEFNRLFNNDQQLNEIASKIDRVRYSAKALGCVVLIKGADTVVATPDGRAAVTANAPPWLATAGTGDVLSGIVAGLLAQGMPPFEAACAAVWLHGEAGREAGPGMISEDLDPAMKSVIAKFVSCSMP